MTELLEKQDIFEARTGGYHVYRIPGLIVTERGVVIAHCEARKGRGGDWDPIDICMRRSLDGGRTWSEPAVAVDHTWFDAEKPVNNFICIPDAMNGDVHVLFCSNYERVFYMKSRDDCVSFSDPRDVTAAFEAFRSEYPWRVIAVGPGHGIQLQNGRLVATVWMSDGSSSEHGKGRLGHRPSEAGVVYSDDRGKTWQAGDIVVHNEEEFRHPNESCVVELASGHVLLNVRTESHTHRRLIATSPNGATDWSPPEFDDALVEPICFGGIVGYEDDDGTRNIVFSNPGVLERTMAGGPASHGIGPQATGRPFDRKHLTVRLSTDDCTTWECERRLEDGPSGYSDLAVLSDGTLLCLYECGIVDRMYDDRYLRLARFDSTWIRGGVR